jgi:Secretion system C-terminal sorting domain
LALDIIELPDSGYLIPVVSNVIFEVDTFGFAKTYLQILRVDKDGDTIYQRNYFKKGFSIATWCIVKTNDNNYLIAGHIYDLVKYHNDTIGSKILLVKINNNGDTLWSKTLDIGDGDEFAKKLINTNDGGYAIMGQVCDKLETNCDMYLMKLDSNANMEWYKTYTWDENYWENPSDFLQSIYGEYYLISATTNSLNNFRNAYIVKTDSLGNSVWSKKVDHGNLGYGHFVGINYGNNNTLLITGVIGDLDKGVAWLIQMDTSGNFLMNKTIGDPNKYSMFRKAFQLNDKIIVQGTTNEYNPISENGRPCLYAFNLNGDKIWRRVYQDSTINNQTYLIYNSKKTLDGGYAMIGFGRNPNAVESSQDVWLIKVDSMGCLVDNCISLGYAEDNVQPNYFYAYPNPTNRYINLSTNLEIQKIEVFDMLGRKVFIQDYTPTNEIDLESLPNGMYTIKAEDKEGKVFIEKVLVDR